jgi:plasmid stabilization system protein ParE
MPNTLHYSPEALEDLDKIFDYIAFEKQNPIALQIQLCKEELVEAVVKLISNN